MEKRDDGYSNANSININKRFIWCIYCTIIIYGSYMICQGAYIAEQKMVAFFNPKWVMICILFLSLCFCFSKFTY